MICWYCHWGWPKAVADIYNRAFVELDCDSDPLTGGPGHIVWGDENFDSTKWCLEHFDEYGSDRFSTEQLAIVRRSLEELDAMPDDLKEAEPDDYEGEHPENFPPTVPVTPPDQIGVIPAGHWTRVLP